jgi:hypothetical protein
LRGPVVIDIQAAKRATLAKDANQLCYMSINFINWLTNYRTFAMNMVEAAGGHA